MNIKNTEGDRLVITSTQLRLPMDCHASFIYLKDVPMKTGSVRGYIDAFSDTCMFGNPEGKPFYNGFYLVSYAKQEIGCCTFSKETWKKIIAAAKAARKRKK